MLDFFIALFGGAYFAGKYVHEKGKEKQYEIEQSKREAARLRLQSRFVATPERARLAEEYVFSGLNYDKICEEFQEDFRYIFGANWRKILQIPPIPITKSKYMVNDSVYHVTWVKSLVLASHGKIEDKFIWGYEIMNNEPTKELAYKFLQCMQKRLNSRGFHDSFVITEAQHKSQKVTIEPLAIFPIVKKLSQNNYMF